jgi:4,5-DOPA dioxygenase extradiol
METQQRMPVLFVGHGNPMNAIEDNQFTAAWQEMAIRLPVPAAILCISAHWETEGTLITAMARPRTIHDFYGFPEELYRVRYPAPGAPELAESIRVMLGGKVSDDTTTWGLDHGVWSVLCRMFPKADLPVVQLSLDRTLSARGHYQLARELQPLRAQGVLIIGSGNIVHNLRMMQWGGTSPYPWALEFDRIAAQLILDGDHELLIDYPALGKEALLAVPTNEHYLPLLYALALRNGGETTGFFAEGIVYGSISMRSVTIGL